MKNFLRLFIFAVFIFLLSANNFLRAQTFDNAGDYISAINNSLSAMDQTYLAYMSAVAHSGRARKVEKMRQQTLESIQNSKYKISELPYYKSDNTLRQSSMGYVDLCYKVFNDDYAHIVNMEEIAEQSVDEMEAYLLLQEKTNEKVHEASGKMDSALHVFAKKYNVTLTENKTELDANMEMASGLNHYRNLVYIVFFKCDWEDEQITDALNKKNLNNIEQSRNALLTYATEGLKALQADSLSNFKGDHSLAQACNHAMQFYKEMAETEIPKLTDFFLKQEAFDKLKKSFDAKPESKRTKDDVDAYNKGVDDLNKAVNNYNDTNTKINNDRAAVIQNWNDTQKTFLDVHMPHYEM